jgi:hypothetical protein
LPDVFDWEDDELDTWASIRRCKKF